jgi:hypothetical protein
MESQVDLPQLLIQGAPTSNDPFQQKLVIVSLSVMTIVLLCLGAVWAINPPLFVRLYRRIAAGNFYVKSADWERRFLSECRFGGFVFLFFGLGGLYLLLRILRII